ncbi:MAG: glucosamine--fructose-6-phosphate aminotransferase, partial [Gammaproteobacteria bacterium]|nr:glucosamine--fructose-6-phosphate aminotransferase [Gammaproteobacteria bacterium]
MTQLPNALKAWSTDSYSRTIKNELQSLEQGVLPLEKGLTEGGEVDDSNITVTVFESSDNEQSILTKVTVFFSEMSGACSCAGDGPYEVHAHCTMVVSIDKSTAEAN